MNFKFKKFIAGVSAIAVMSTFTVGYTFADEIDTTSATETLLNNFNKPLTQDGIHGDTNLEDMEYVHYELSDIQDDLDSIINLADADYTTKNVLILSSLETDLDNFYYKLSTSYSLIYLYYNQEPTTDNLIEYTHTSDLINTFFIEYQNAMKTMLNGSFGVAILNELEQYSSIDESAKQMYEYYSSFLYDDSMNEEAQAIRIEINNKLNEYYSMIQSDISNETVVVDGVSTTYGQLLNDYNNLYINLISNYSSIDEIPEEDLNLYYSLSEAIKSTKQSYGLDSDTFMQLYIDIVKLYNEYAKASGYSNYIEYSYNYDVDEINQISSDVKQYVIPVLEEYKDQMNSNPMFKQLNDISIDVNEAKEVSNMVISSVGEKYLDIYNYMTEHGLLVLDDDYVYPSGYTTSIPEYSQAYIYLTFDNDNVFDWFTNGIAHEFGHFIDWHHNMENFAQGNMATAENVSISFSYICNDNLDAYFDENVSNMLSISGAVNNAYTYVNNTLSMNEFELYAFQNSDTITVEELNQKYLDIRKDYGLMKSIAYDLGYNELFNIGQTNQLYTMPFYMVDYGMAGLTSLNVLNEYVQDNQQGLQTFDLLYSNDYYYSDYVTMMQEGIGIDIYADDYVLNASNVLNDYLNSKMEAVLEHQKSKLGDINNDGEISGVDLIMLKKYVLGVDRQMDTSMSDLNEDGKTNLLDLLILKRKIMGLI